MNATPVEFLGSNDIGRVCARHRPAETLEAVNRNKIPNL